MALQISLTDGEGVYALTASFGAVVFVNIPLLNFSVTMAAWFQTLPTTLPASPGQPWNNSGTLSFS